MIPGTLQENEAGFCHFGFVAIFSSPGPRYLLGNAFDLSLAPTVGGF